MASPDIYKKSLLLHEKLGGKLEIRSKKKITSRAILSLLYTPGVAEPSRVLASTPGRARELSIKKNTIAVVSDGSAVLGLGNIGPFGAIPVMEGKAVLFKELGGVDAFPICLQTQDPVEIVETVRRISPVFGGINLEDISAPRCFEVEEALQDLGIPVMHDDQHGTAIVILAALKNALRVAGKRASSCKLVISGAGAAATATMRLLLASEERLKEIVIVDSKGIVSSDRPDLNQHKQEIAESTGQRRTGTLEEALVGADIFIGLSAPGIVRKEMVARMASKPIVFAMANPVPEIMPEEAAKGGAYIIGTGRSDYPNQINNVLAFPGIFRGALDCGATRITTEMKLAAAEAIASLVKSPARGRIIPDALDKRAAKAVATAVAREWKKAGN